MCIVAFAWQVLDDLPLCLISNRDEFYQKILTVLSHLGGRSHELLQADY